MTAAIINLTGDTVIEAGATNIFEMTLTYASNGDPVNLTPYSVTGGGTLRGQFRLLNADSETVVFQVVNGLTDVSPAPATGVYIASPPTNGKLVVVLSDANTSAAQVAGHLAGTFDIEGVDSSSIVARLVQGEWALSKENTRTIV